VLILGMGRVGKGAYCALEREYGSRVWGVESDAERVAALKTEVSSLSETHGEQAHSIAAFTDLSTHEATRTQKDPALLNHALGGLGHSVREFKVSHPDLVKSVDNICRVLAGIGV